MSSNYPEGSMRGSGIYAQEVSYDEFDCENKECGETNSADTATTDDWGNYSVECKSCGVAYKESNLTDDKDDYYADQERDDY
jgi:hypothetical protein